jgi:hypothetical protein
MSPHSKHPPFLIRSSRHRSQLRVHVIGESTLDNTIAYWQAILAEVEKKPAEQILLIDELQGEPLTESEWLSLVRNMSNHGLEQIRIAHVKPHGLHRIEYCEIFARDAGFNSRVFDNEHAAGIWLRYGET